MAFGIINPTINGSPLDGEHRDIVENNRRVEMGEGDLLLDDFFKIIGKEIPNGGLSEKLQQLETEELRSLHEDLIDPIFEIDRPIRQGSDEHAVWRRGSIQAHGVIVEGGEFSYLEENGTPSFAKIERVGLIFVIDCLPLGHKEAIDELRYATSLVVLNDAIELLEILQDELDSHIDPDGNLFVGAANVTNTTMAAFAQKTLGFCKFLEATDNINAVFRLNEGVLQPDETIVVQTFEGMLRNLPRLKKLKDRAYSFGLTKGEYVSLDDARMQLIEHILIDFNNNLFDEV